MARSRHCDACNGWHDTNEEWPSECMAHFIKRAIPDDAPQVMGDIQPYKSMITGEMILGRKQHRDHLKAHGRREVGNEYAAHVQRPRPEPLKVTETIRKAVQAVEQGYRTRVLSRQEFES